MATAWSIKEGAWKFPSLSRSGVTQIKQKQQQQHKLRSRRMETPQQAKADAKMRQQCSECLQQLQKRFNPHQQRSHGQQQQQKKLQQQQRRRYLLQRNGSCRHIQPQCVRQQLCRPSSRNAAATPDTSSSHNSSISTSRSSTGSSSSSSSNSNSRSSRRRPNVELKPGGWLLVGFKGLVFFLSFAQALHDSVSLLLTQIKCSTSTSSSSSSSSSKNVTTASRSSRISGRGCMHIVVLGPWRLISAKICVPFHRSPPRPRFSVQQQQQQQQSG
ncbi:hypothetical protein Emag_003966 [Eimeria magna]